MDVERAADLHYGVAPFTPNPGRFGSFIVEFGLDARGGWDASRALLLMAETAETAEWWVHSLLWLGR